MEKIIYSFINSGFAASETFRISELILIDIVATVISVLPFILILLFLYKRNLLNKRAVILISLILTVIIGFFSTSINTYYYPLKILNFFIFLKENPFVMLSDVSDVAGYICIGSVVLILSLLIYGLKKRLKDKMYRETCLYIFAGLIVLILFLYPNVIWIVAKKFGQNMEYRHQLFLEKLAGEKTVFPYFKNIYINWALGRIETRINEYDENYESIDEKDNGEYQALKVMYDDILAESCNEEVPVFQRCGKVIVKDIIDGNYDEAIKAADKAAKNNPKHAEYFNLYKIHAYMFKGDFETAFELSNGKYSRFSPGNEGSLVKAEIYRGLKDYDKAFVYADKYEKKDNCNGYLLKMSLYADIGDFGESKKNHEKYKKECKYNEKYDDYRTCLIDYGYLKHYENSVFAHYPDTVNDY